MEIRNLIFTENLPRIDLHGYIREEVSYFVNDFIQDNVKMKNEFIVIIHGIGSNILSKEVHNTLSKNKQVLDYKYEFNNLGCTIVKINIKNK